MSYPQVVPGIRTGRRLVMHKYSPVIHKGQEDE